MENAPLVHIWLDDTRPAPTGWVHCRNIEEVKPYLLRGQVYCLSIDNDLGHEFRCGCGKSSCTEEGDDHVYGYHEVPNGSQLIDWMEQTGNWSAEQPTVHDASSASSRYIHNVISKYYHQPSGSL